MANKQYIVNIDKVWSEDIKVSAKNKSEAKQKAFEIYKKRLKRKDLNFYVETIVKY